MPLSHTAVVRLVLLAVLITGAVLRFNGLGSSSLWYDEIFGLALAQQPMSVVLDVISGFVANMALYLVLMHYWMALVDPNVSDAVPRIPSVIFGLAGIWAIYQLASDLFDRRAGLVAALLMAVNPYHIGWSQDARSYTMWTLFVTLGYWSLLRATRSPGRSGWWLAYALTMAVAFYSHLFTIFIAVSQGLWMLARWRPAELRRFAIASVALGALLVPLALFGMANTDGSQLRHVPLPNFKDFRLMLRAYAGGEWPQFGYAALMTMGVISLLVGPRPSDRREKALLLGLWLFVLPALLLGLSFVYKPLFRERYVIAALPAAILLAAAAFSRIRLVLVGGVILAALVAMSSASVSAGYEVRRDEDWRGAVGYLAGQAQPNDGFIFISRRNHLPWQYYAPRYGVDPLTISDIEPFDWHELAWSRTYRSPRFNRSELDRFAQDHPRIWLVLSHEFDAYEQQDDGGDTAAWVRDRLTRTGYSARQRLFPSVRLLLYENHR